MKKIIPFIALFALVGFFTAGVASAQTVTGTFDPSRTPGATDDMMYRAYTGDTTVNSGTVSTTGNTTTTGSIAVGDVNGQTTAQNTSGGTVAYSTTDASTPGLPNTGAGDSTMMTTMLASLAIAFGGAYMFTKKLA